MLGHIFIFIILVELFRILKNMMTSNKTCLYLSEGGDFIAFRGK